MDAKQEASAPKVVATSSSSRFWRYSLTLLCAGFLVLLTNVRAVSSLSVEERVDKILSETPLTGRYQVPQVQDSYADQEDGHNDLASLVRYIFDNHIYGSNFTEPFTHGSFPGQVDLPRLAEGKVGGTFWSVYVSCPENGTDFSDENYATSKEI
jgi:membrane dipeptidase